MAISPRAWVSPRSTAWVRWVMVRTRCMSRSWWMSCPAGWPWSPDLSRES